MACTEHTNSRQLLSRCVSLPQEDAGLRAAKAEAELRSLQERLREEQAACDALKKQMGEAHQAT